MRWNDWIGSLNWGEWWDQGWERGRSPWLVLLRGGVQKKEINPVDTSVRGKHRKRTSAGELQKGRGVGVGREILKNCCPRSQWKSLSKASVMMSNAT